MSNEQTNKNNLFWEQGLSEYLIISSGCLISNECLGFLNEWLSLN